MLLTNVEVDSYLLGHYEIEAWLILHDTTSWTHGYGICLMGNGWGDLSFDGLILFAFHVMGRFCFLSTGINFKLYVHLFWFVMDAKGSLDYHWKYRHFSQIVILFVLALYTICIGVSFFLFSKLLRMRVK